MQPLVVLLAVLPTRAQQPPPPDTTQHDTARVVRGREVLVQSSSVLIRESRSAQPVAVVERAQIEAANARDLSDAVALSPGVSVRQYGGHGGLRTVSVRGTSAQQTVVLIDGLRYGSSAGDAFDFSNIPAATLQRVEVLRGGDAARFGANALGGVVNIVTAPESRNPTLRAAASLHAGSFGDVGAGAGGSGGTGDHHFDGSIHFTQASGKYPFSYSEFGTRQTRHRQNADFSNLFARAGWSFLRDGTRVSASLQGFSSERGTPGAVVQGSLEQSAARLAERDLFGVATAAWFDAEWMGTIGATGRANWLNYDDPAARITGPEGTHSRFRRTEGTVAARLRRQFGGDGSNDGAVETSIEASHAQLNGNNLDPSVGQRVARTQLSAAVAADWLLQPLLANDELLCEAALRADIFSDVGNSISPSVGLNYRPTALPFRFRLHASANFRAPSFTEQYYLNYGNANLRPERSFSLDVGALYQFGERFLADGTLFLIETKDLILSVPRSPVSWSAMNIGRARSRGVEFGASGSLLEDCLLLRLAWTQMEASDQSSGVFNGKELPYSPRQTASGVCQVRFAGASVGISASYSSYRYSLASNSSQSVLGGYWLAGGNVAYQFAIGSLWWVATARVENLFDADYRVIRNYPMPGRSFRLGMECRVR